MDKIILKDEYIKLGQALKAAGLVSSGIDAKMVIQEGMVKVDGEVELRRGRKLYDGAVVEFDNQTVKIIGGKTDDSGVSQNQ